jgi:hypothetical protein
VGTLKDPSITSSRRETAGEAGAHVVRFPPRIQTCASLRSETEVGQPGEVIVEFPLSEWLFNAFFSPAGEECGRIQQMPLEPTGDREFLLRPAGYAGTYDVTIFGRGNGSLSTTFLWTTPTSGPLPKPKARLAVLAQP